LIAIAIGGGGYAVRTWYQSATTQIAFPKSGLALRYPAAAWSLDGKVLSSINPSCGDQEYGALKYHHTNLELTVGIGSCAPGAGKEGPCATTGPFACTTETREVATILLSPGVKKYVLAQKNTLFGVTVYRLLVSDGAVCDALNCPLTITGTTYDQNVVMVSFIGDPMPTFTSLDGFVRDGRVVAGLQVLRTLHYG
jgi:hypothetical protein